MDYASNHQPTASAGHEQYAGGPGNSVQRHVEDQRRQPGESKEGQRRGTTAIREGNSSDGTAPTCVEQRSEPSAGEDAEATERITGRSFRQPGVTTERRSGRSFRQPDVKTERTTGKSFRQPDVTTERTTGKSFRQPDVTTERTAGR